MGRSAAVTGLVLAAASGCGTYRDGQSLLSAFGPVDAGDATVDAPKAPRLTLDAGTPASPGCISGNTSISGRVYDPAGKNPLYGVVVYVPAGPVAPLPPGPTCESCSSLYSGGVLASATTGSDGSFTLENVPLASPATTSVPLILQVGKWRKQIAALAIDPCAATAVPDGQLALPGNHTDPGNDIPSIAISTGGADTLECLLRRVGVDAAEYGPGASGSGRIHIFTGSSEGSPNTVPGSGGGFYGPAPTTSPPAPDSYTSLWDTEADLLPYDMVLLSCEGRPTSDVTAASQQNLLQYTSAGGRVFASHYHYVWLDTGPFGSDGLALWTPDFRLDAGLASVDGGLVSVGAPNTGSGSVLTAFPKGKALDEWLGNVNALIGGTLPVVQPRFDVTYDPSMRTRAQTWIVTPSETTIGVTSAEYLSFNTPVGAVTVGQCGRVVFSDIHVSGAVTPPDYTGASEVVPDGCTDADLTPQEKALEFMLFDLSSCVVPDDQAPTAPPPSK